MARQTTWVLALLVTCVAAGNGASAGAQQARPAATQQAPAAKDNTRTRTTRTRRRRARKPDERERWKWWLYDRAELGINDQQSASINADFRVDAPETARDAPGTGSRRRGNVPHHQGAQGGSRRRQRAARPAGERPLAVQQDPHPDALSHAPAAQRRAAHQARGAARPDGRRTAGIANRPGSVVIRNRSSSID